MNKLFENMMIMTLNDWAAFCGITAFFISIISIAFSARKYVTMRSQEQRQKNFENYHKILKAVSTGLDESYKQSTLESQLAYIFELRNFPAYRDITKRSLKSLKDDWEINEKRPKNKKLLIEEIDYTLKKL